MQMIQVRSKSSFVLKAPAPGIVGVARTEPLYSNYSRRFNRASCEGLKLLPEEFYNIKSIWAKNGPKRLKGLIGK